MEFLPASQVPPQGFFGVSGVYSAYVGLIGFRAYVGLIGCRAYVGLIGFRAYVGYIRLRTSRESRA